MSKKKKQDKVKADNPFIVQPKPRIGPIEWLRSRFFAGIIVTAPIGISVFLVWWFITFVDDKVKPLIPERWNPETYTQFGLPGLGVLVGVLFLIVVGTVATNLIGKSLLGMADRIISRVPLVSNIHGAFKQIFETLATSQSGNFKEVVLVEYPRPGAWAVGFVTSSAKGDLAEKVPGMIGVFIPTTPNPTSGFLIYVNREDTKKLDMSVEDGAKLIISAGLVVPDQKLLPAQGPTAETSPELRKVDETPAVPATKSEEDMAKL